MHEVVFYLATVWMAGLLSICILVMLRSRSSMTRILALDAVSLMLIAFLVLYSDSRKVSYYLDAALVLALLSYLSTIAAARYQAEGKIF